MWSVSASSSGVTLLLKHTFHLCGCWFPVFPRAPPVRTQKLLATELDLYCWFLSKCWTMFGWVCHTLRKCDSLAGVWSPVTSLVLPQEGAGWDGETGRWSERGPTYAGEGLFSFGHFPETKHVKAAGWLLLIINQNCDKINPLGGNPLADGYSSPQTASVKSHF